MNSAPAASAAAVNESDDPPSVLPIDPPGSPPVSGSRVAPGAAGVAVPASAAAVVVGVAVAVAVTTGVDVGVDVTVGVEVTVGVDVAVAVAVAVGWAAHDPSTLTSAARTVSMPMAVGPVVKTP